MTRQRLCSLIEIEGIKENVKLCILFGTRPEIIKMSPLIRVCQELGQDYFALHTCQHASFEMDEVFFRDLELPTPRYRLEEVGRLQSRSTATLLAAMMTGIEAVLADERPDVVLVPSDPHTTLAGAVIAGHMQIKVGHVESGLRSYDWSMPEELNRIMTDHISTYLFAPTEAAAAILRRENIPESRIFVTGNTVVDAVKRHLPIAMKASTVLARLSLTPQRYFLCTTHRAENLNDPIRLGGILSGISRVQEHFGLPVLVPIHPSLERALRRHSLNLPPGVQSCEPAGYLDFLVLQASAAMVLTDSGGLQEETAVLAVPCVTLRDNTERPESVEAGSNILAGTDPERILRCSVTMSERRRDWINPFGDGHAADRIISIVRGGA